MRMPALFVAAAAVLALAACQKKAEDHAAAKPASDAVEAAGAAEDAVLTPEEAAHQAALVADQTAQNAGALDSAAPATAPDGAPTPQAGAAPASVAVTPAPAAH
ncbi:hypothetical protein [Brevundimonas sp.]|uniref:hypothetical protein n=1 Tax=Brevundimonas sp. TaxID=1871086 RepID=UPI0028A13B44|nr:hypothetical protein [Brevundimonas sp.]